MIKYTLVRGVKNSSTKHDWIKVYLLLLLINVLLLSSACAGGGSSKEVLIGPPGEKRSRPQRRAPLPRIANQTQIASVLKDLENLLGRYSNLDPNRRTEVLYFEPAIPTERSIGQRILIVEDIGFPLSSVLRYKNRVLDILRLSQHEAGTYERLVSSVAVTEPLKAVGDYLAKLPFHVPVNSLGPTASQLKSIQANGSDYADIALNNAHLSDTFELLADLNPEAQFVLAQIPIIDTYTFCHFYDSNILNKIRSLYARAALNLFGIMSKYDINYINISWAPSRERFIHQYSHMCKNDTWNILNLKSQELSEFLSIEAEFYNKLSQFKNVGIFKALPNESWSEQSSDSCMNDVMSSPSSNFLNIGYFSIPQYQWGKSGGWSSEYLNFHQKNLAACADVYINGGFMESESDEEIDTDALGPEPLKIRRRGLNIVQPKTMSTSLATPIALSMVNYLIQIGIIDSVSKVKAWLKEYSHNPKLLDPLKFHLFELYSTE